MNSKNANLGRGLLVLRIKFPYGILYLGVWEGVICIALIFMSLNFFLIYPHTFWKPFLTIFFFRFSNLLMFTFIFSALYHVNTMLNNLHSSVWSFHFFLLQKAPKYIPGTKSLPKSKRWKIDDKEEFEFGDNICLRARKTFNKST